MSDVREALAGLVAHWDSGMNVTGGDSPEWDGSPAFFAWQEKLDTAWAAARAALAQEPAAPQLRFTLREARQLVGTFGGDDAEVTVRELAAGVIKGDADDASSPAGLWAHFTEYPEEGSLYLGPQEVCDEPAEIDAIPPPMAVHGSGVAIAKHAPADDLVRRLLCDPDPDVVEAGERIEALQAEVAQLRLQAIGNCQHWKDAYDRMALRMQDQEVRAEAAEARAAAAVGDAARLSWLDRDDVELKPTTIGGRPVVMIINTRNGVLIAKGDDIRAAIDAAIAAQDAKP